eukprot:COSAG01_NODE_227_length_21107_cov_85.615099_20_plen_101_part_00
MARVLGASSDLLCGLRTEARTCSSTLIAAAAAADHQLHCTLTVVRRATAAVGTAVGADEATISLPEMARPSADPKIVAALGEMGFGVRSYIISYHIYILS